MTPTYIYSTKNVLQDIKLLSQYSRITLCYVFILTLLHFETNYITCEYCKKINSLLCVIPFSTCVSSRREKENQLVLKNVMSHWPNYMQHLVKCDSRKLIWTSRRIIMTGSRLCLYFTLKIWFSSIGRTLNLSIVITKKQKAALFFWERSLCLYFRFIQYNIQKKICLWICKCWIIWRRSITISSQYHKNLI